MRTGDNFSKINPYGLYIITTFEGCKLTVYLDVAGYKTVGYGHRTESMVVGTTITAEQAVELLEQDLVSAESAVQSFVKVPLTSNEFSALVSFVFNEGAGNFKRSSLLKRLNEKDYIGASIEFTKWDEAGGEIVPGLLRRRQAEQALFMKEDV